MLKYGLLLAASGAAVLAYTWVLYPTAVRVAAWGRRRQRSNTAADPPFVSVIVASREPMDVIRARVRNIVHTTYPKERLEIVIGRDSGHERESLQEDLQATPLHIVPGDAPGGKAATLNAAVRAARGRILVFTDSYQEFFPETIGTLVSELESDSSLGAVSGTLDIQGGPWLVRTYWRYERWLRYWESVVHSSVGVTGAVYAMRRELWRPLPPGLLLDDLYTPMRLVLSGYRVGWSREARARDARQMSVREERKRKARTLTGVLQLCAWLPDVLVPWRNPIWLQFVSHKLLRLVTPFALAALFVGSTVVAVETLDRRWLLVSTLLTTAAAGTCVAASRRVRELLSSAVAVQLATVRALWNAARGKWDVW